MIKILYLSNNSDFNLVPWLKSQDILVIECSEKIVNMLTKKFDYIISYNYKYIINEAIVKKFKNKIINLHISYLPFNRGAYPNVWSFLEDTPKGVTIHFIDEGVDTGEILFQKEMFFDESAETFRSTHCKLNIEIQKLFQENWDRLITKNFTPMKQQGKGTFHKKADLEPIINYFGEKFWDLPIKEIKEVIKKKHLIVK